MNENLPFVIKFSRSNQDECLILCLFISTSCVQAVRVRKINMRAVAQLTFHCSSRNSSSRVNLVIFCFSETEDMASKISGMDCWSTSVLFQDDKGSQA